MKKHILLLLSLSTILCPSVSANDPVGIEITYKFLGNPNVSYHVPIYEITLVRYRSCSTTPLSDPTSGLKISCPSLTTKASTTPTLVSIEDVSNISGHTGSCTSSSTGTHGLLKITHKDTIDFSLSPYSSYATCSETRIEYTNCCRSSNVINGGVQYIYASLFLPNFPINSTVTSTRRPLYEVECDQPASYFHQISNPDTDSISYETIAPMTSATASSSYSTNFSPNKPLDVFTQNTIPGVTNVRPDADPPIGFWFDSTSADMIFTPTNCNQTSYYTIRMTEWRLKNGTMQKTGVTLREHQIKTILDPYNRPPTFQNLPNIPIQSCYKTSDTLWLEVQDRIFIPPPPTNIGPADTLEFQVESDYPIKLVIDSQSYKSNGTSIYGYIHWNSDSFATTPSSFDVYVRAIETNRDAYQNYVTKKITIQFIDSMTSVSANTVANSCGTIIQTIEPDTINGLPTTRKFEVRDSNQKLLYSKQFYANESIDTFSLATESNGPFYIKSYSYLSKKCAATHTQVIPMSYFDGAIIPTERKIFICPGDSGLSVDPKWSSILWNTGDTSSFIPVNESGIFTVSLANECSDQFQHIFYVDFREYTGDLQDTSICNSGVASYSYSPAAYMYGRWPDSSTGEFYSSDLAGDFVLTVTDYMCNSFAYTDSFSVSKVLDPVADILEEDLLLCDGADTFLRSNSYSQNESSIWSTGSDSASAYVNSTERVTLIASNVCGSSTDQVSVVALESPRVDLGNDTLYTSTSQLLKNATPTAGTQLLWSTGETADFIQILLPGTYWLRETNGCGSASDTIVISERAGIQTLESIGVTLHPNPARDVFSLTSSNDINGHLTILNNVGQTILTKPIVNSATEINISALSTGVYTVILELKNEVYSTKLLKD